MRSHAFLLVAALLAGATQAAGEAMCTPEFVVRAAKLSDIELDQCTWSVRIAVDAARSRP